MTEHTKILTAALKVFGHLQLKKTETFTVIRLKVELAMEESLIINCLIRLLSKRLITYLGGQKIFKLNSNFLRNDFEALVNETGWAEAHSL